MARKTAKYTPDRGAQYAFTKGIRVVHGAPVETGRVKTIVVNGHKLAVREKQKGMWTYWEGPL